MIFLKKSKLERESYNLGEGGILKTEKMMFQVVKMIKYY